MSADPFVTTFREWMRVFMRQSMHQFIHYVRNSGLSMSHFGAMFHIHHKGRCGVTELGDHLDVSSAAASQMLERLVQQDYISRTEDPHDRRVKQIVLTNKGNEVLEEGIHAHECWVEELAAVLSDDEKEAIREALGILIEKIEKLDQPVEPEC